MKFAQYETSETKLRTYTDTAIVTPIKAISSTWFVSRWPAGPSLAGSLVV